jgi:hypothetical protein
MYEAWIILLKNVKKSKSLHPSAHAQSASDYTAHEQLFSFIVQKY